MKNITARGGARRAFESSRLAGVCAVGVLCIAAAGGSRWLVAFNAGGSQNTYQSHGCLTSPRLSDHTAMVLLVHFQICIVLHTHVKTIKK